ncbi:single-stranded-DNA-specific exonuclease RecJ [Chromatiales bacterium (ex Bugula neritina AB1)]|nr:single-stranded-DNA-specific exonuclease RecJ [Chromatiales bacterium (ex Bugula neritina AB1)]
MSADAIRRRPYDKKIAERLHEQAFIGRVLAGRGVAGADELELPLKDLLLPGALKDFDRAVELLVAAVGGGQSILIVGDYDADGATSTALAVRVLRTVGANVSYLVPNRFKFGYGLSREIVAVALRSKPDLIVTVDNGIASIDGVRAAKEAGVPVLVTDHHLPPPELPAADAIVNPNREDCSFPGKNLCGVGVIFYVMTGMIRRLQRNGWFEGRDTDAPRMTDFLDLVAIGTVADVVPLDRNNRILIEQGLRRIRAGLTYPGVLALFKVAGRDHRSATSDDLGFVIGPRLNAAGRLDDISVGIECLLSADLKTAQRIARELDQFNRTRRKIESGMREQGFRQVEAVLSAQSGVLPSTLCLYEPDWHEGVIGIVAGRVKEHCYRPVFAFAKAADGMLKGSGRSIPGIHIRDVLMSIAATEPDLLSKFGGHAMAAGVSLAEHNFERFNKAFAVEVARITGGISPHREWLSDGALSDAEMSLLNARALKYLQPWGQSFPAPLFDDVFHIRSVKIVGSGHSRLILKRTDGNRDIPAMAFNRKIESNSEQKWQIVYRLDVNLFREQETVQLLVEHMALIE